jgi:branched-chain amino acid transport system permease protein
VIVYGALLVFLILLPFLMKGYYLIVVGNALFYVLLGLSLNIITGFAGRISICHGAFYGIGAYACGLLIVKTGMAFWPALVLGTIITGILSFLVGIPFVRAKGPYFAIGTLCFGAIVSIILLNWVSLTGGVSLRGIDGPTGIGIFSLHTMKTYFYLLLAMVLFYIYINYRILHSRVGRALVAIREDETLAECIAVNVKLYKLFAFTCAGLLAGLAGGLYAGHMGAIDPGLAAIAHSFIILIMLVVGGAGTISGAIIGPLLLWILPESLMFADEFRLLIYGVILLVIIIFLPRGIAGQLRTLSPAIARWLP